MTTTSISAADLIRVTSSPDARRAAAIEIVVPVYNEAGDLDRSIRRLHDYLSTSFPLSWIITIADNASTDETWDIACQLATRLERVQALRLEEKGRGRALRAAWSTTLSPVVAYMDVDLSTDLDALLPLVAPLVSGHSDLAIGTRLASRSRVVRGPKREAISRSYNLLLRATLRSGFSDAQCGFKAVRTEVAHELLPLVEDQGWFFDTELLVVAEHNGMRIHEVPVDWIDDPDSRVDVISTAKADLRGIWRMVGRLARGGAELPTGAGRTVDRPDVGSGSALSGQLVRFASIGAVSTVVFAVLFALLRGPLGALPADVVALAICATANTAANRRLTFSLHGRSGRHRHYAAGLALTALPLVLTLSTLVALEALGWTSLLAMLIALTTVNALATVGRFVLLREWAFRS